MTNRKDGYIGGKFNEAIDSNREIARSLGSAWLREVIGQGDRIILKGLPSL
jgi:hypothetical protein